MRTIVLLMSIAVLLLVPSAAIGTPQIMHFQGFLTDNMGEPVNGSANLTFTIYDQETGGTPLWIETHPAISVEGGLFSVTLGTSSPIPASLFQGDELWIGVTAAGDYEMTPRQRISSAAFAFRASASDTASHAFWSDASAFAIDSDHSHMSDTADYAHSAPPAPHHHDGEYVSKTGPDAMGANSTDPALLVENTGEGPALKGVNVYGTPKGSKQTGGPGVYGWGATGFGGEFTSTSNYAIWCHGDSAGYFDGDVHVAGDLTVAGSYPGGGGNYDNVYINENKADTMTATTGPSEYTLTVSNPGTGGGIRVPHAHDTAIRIDSSRVYGVYVDSVGVDGVVVSESGDDAFYAHSCAYGMYLYETEKTGVVLHSSGSHDLYGHQCDSTSIVIQEPGLHGIEINEPGANGIVVRMDSLTSSLDGIRVSNSADDGVQIDSCAYGVYVLRPARNGLNIFQSGDDAIYISGSARDGIFVSQAGGNGGYFQTADTSKYAVVAMSATGAGKGLKVFGNAHATGTWAKTVTTSKGPNSVSTLSTPYEDIVASGRAKLSGGEAYVEFEELFSEVVSTELPIKITVTPRGKWSGMYVAESSAEGFMIKVGAGATDAEFDWTAIGRTRGHEIRRPVKLITPEEFEAGTNKHRAEAEAKREAGDRMPRRATFPADKM